MEKRKRTALNLIRKRKEVKKNFKSHADRRAEHQFVKNLKPRAKKETNSFESHVKEKRSQKNSKPRVARRAELQL